MPIIDNAQTPAQDRRDPGPDLLQVLDQAGQGVVCLSATGTILTANAAAERILGLAAAGLQGRKLTDPLWLMIGEDGVVLGEDRHPAALALRTGQAAANVVVGIHHPQTQKISWAKVTAVPLVRPGQAASRQVCMILLDVTHQKQVEHRLGERIKELRAFYALAEIAGQEDLALEETYQRIIDTLPESWQYPEVACGRISIGGQEFRSANFQPTPWVQSASLVVKGEAAGVVEVGYLTERPVEDEGPLPERGAPAAGSSRGTDRADHRAQAGGRSAGASNPRPARLEQLQPGSDESIG